MGCPRGNVRGDVYEAVRDESCFCPVFFQRNKRKRQKYSGMRITRIFVARDVHESLKKIKCMCAYSSIGHGLR